MLTHTTRICVCASAAVVHLQSKVKTTPYTVPALTKPFSPTLPPRFCFSPNSPTHTTHSPPGVPTSTSSKLKANEWVNSALTVLGGKGGGKPTVAQGQGNEFTKAADALAAAEQFAGLKL